MKKVFSKIAPLNIGFICLGALFSIQCQVAFAMDFNGHWRTGKLMEAKICYGCYDDSSKWQSFAAAMSSSDQTLVPITSLVPLEINIVMTATQISLPIIHVMALDGGEISSVWTDTETFKIDGEKLTYSCPYADRFDRKIYCKEKFFGSIVGNVVTIYQKYSIDDPAVIDVARYILNPDGSLRYGHGTAADFYDYTHTFQASVGDFQRQ